MVDYKFFLSNLFLFLNIDSIFHLKLLELHNFNISFSHLLKSFFFYLFTKIKLHYAIFCRRFTQPHLGEFVMFRVSNRPMLSKMDLIWKFDLISRTLLQLKNFLGILSLQLKWSKKYLIKYSRFFHHSRLPFFGTVLCECM